MSLKILFCSNCKTFLLKEKCVCKNKTIPPLPAKFSVEDSYAKYRREAKKDDWKNRNLI